MSKIKYRIKKNGYRFWPQFKAWYNFYMWSSFIEYNRERNRHVFFSTLEEADKYLDQKKKDNEVIIYER